jgi:glycosyltransferase involved in cell wall biosynthesis
VRESLAAKGPVYGSFGREEKLNSPPFLDAVAEILHRQPEAVFLWTGRVAHPEIHQRLAAAGVASRCRFIGWVDTKLYAQVIDVFLDSFPFPCGFTLYEAMAAGKPVVLFDSAESTTGGINALVAPLLNQPPTDSEESRIAHEVFRPAPGTDYYYRFATPQAYADAAVQLGEDAALRERAGAAARAFVERLMGDPRRAATIYLGHLVSGARRGAEAA